MTKTEFVDLLMSDHRNYLLSIIDTKDSDDESLNQLSYWLGLANLTKKKADKYSQPTTFVYTLNVLSEIKSTDGDYIDMIAGLFHDLGEYFAIDQCIDSLTTDEFLRKALKIGRIAKPFCTDLNNTKESVQSLLGISSEYYDSLVSKIKNKGHEQISCKMASEFMTDLGFNESEINTVLYLIRYHMYAYMIPETKFAKTLKDMIRYPVYSRLRNFWVCIQNGRVGENRVTIKDVSNNERKNKNPLMKELISEFIKKNSKASENGIDLSKLMIDEISI